MSVIFAGKKCKRCGNKWYVSFGHLDWYKKWLKGKETPQSRRYRSLTRTGLCPSCITGRLEPWEVGVKLLKRIEYGRSIKRRKVVRKIKRRSRGRTLSKG